MAGIVPEGSFGRLLEKPSEQTLGLGDFFKNILNASKQRIENQRLSELAEQERIKTPLTKQSLLAEIASKNAYSNLANKRLEQVGQGQGGRSGISDFQRRWSSLPQSERSRITATLSGLGIEPITGLQRMNSGETLDDIAKSVGKNLGDVEPNYAPTTPSITQTQQAEAAASELDVLEKETGGDLSRYGVTFFGYSPAQISDALRGKDKDKMISFLGARALQPEIAAARSRIAGGSNAQQALHDAKDAALANFEIPGFTITPEVRSGVQKYINDKLNKAFKARKSSIYGKKSKDEIISESFRGSALRTSDTDDLLQAWGDAQ